MQDSDYYTVLYFGESIKFHKRMLCKDPVRFLSWFPATHTFMLAKLSPVRNKGTNKAVFLGLEAIMAILMSKKLPGMCIEEGRCFNDAHCGCRFWGDFGTNKNVTYVSFEKVLGEFLPIMLHPEIQHVRNTYGKNGPSFTSSMVEKTPFLQHCRVKKVFIKGFKLPGDEKELNLLFQHAEERRGEDIAYKLRKEVDLMHANPGVLVSNNGKFAEKGGVLGVDYFSRSSLRLARIDKLINGNWGKRPNQKSITEKIIRENMNDHGECFIPWTRGGFILGRMEKGTIIKFDGYMYAHTGGGGTAGCVYPSEAN
jgi:hypothetical protein